MYVKCIVNNILYIHWSGQVTWWSVWCNHTSISGLCEQHSASYTYNAHVCMYSRFTVFMHSCVYLLINNIRRWCCLHTTPSPEWEEDKRQLCSSAIHRHVHMILTVLSWGEGLGSETRWESSIPQNLEDPCHLANSSNLVPDNLLPSGNIFGVVHCRRRGGGGKWQCKINTQHYSHSPHAHTRYLQLLCTSTSTPHFSPSPLSHTSYVLPLTSLILLLLSLHLMFSPHLTLTPTPPHTLTPPSPPGSVGSSSSSSLWMFNTFTNISVTARVEHEHTYIHT